MKCQHHFNYLHHPITEEKAALCPAAEVRRMCIDCSQVFTGGRWQIIKRPDTTLIWVYTGEDSYVPLEVKFNQRDPRRRCLPDISRPRWNSQTAASLKSGQHPAAPPASRPPFRHAAGCCPKPQAERLTPRSGTKSWRTAPRPDDPGLLHHAAPRWAR